MVADQLFDSQTIQEMQVLPMGSHTRKIPEEIIQNKRPRRSVHRVLLHAPCGERKQFRRISRDEEAQRHTGHPVLATPPL